MQAMQNTMLEICKLLSGRDCPNNHDITDVSQHSDHEDLMDLCLVIQRC